MVTFVLNGEEYGVDVMKVREIICMTDITKTGNAPPQVEGMINLRGNIIPVISLRKCFGIPDSFDAMESCIAIMDFAGELTGFIVDGVADVMRVKRSAITPPAELVAQPWMTGTIKINNRIVIVMNLEQLA
jgi:purine-binding chemotaxis protein CheW